MGMRQNIALNYSGYAKGSKVYLYSHWNGDATYKESTLAQRLAKALERRERWDDESYLARIITSEVLRGYEDEETGHGIAPYPVDEEFPTIEVDLEKNTVDGMSFEDFIKACK